MILKHLNFKGVLLQVDLQLAEYELNRIKDRMKRIGVNGEVNDEEQDSINNNGNEETTNEIKELKKRRNEIHFNTIEQYKEKKLRLESKFEDYNNYMLNVDKESSASNSGSSNSIDSENLINSGEMTPFGTRIHFESKPCTSASLMVKTSNKQMKLTDFDKFLTSAEKKTPNSKTAVKKNKPIQSVKKVIVKQNETTDFDKFLCDVVKEEKKSKFDRISNKKDSLVDADAAVTLKPKIVSNSSISVKKVSTNENTVSDFDKFLSQAEGKVVTRLEKKSKNQTNRPVLSTKPETTQANKTKEKIEKKFTNKVLEIKPSDQVISFMKIFEEDESDNDENQKNKMATKIVESDLETENIISNAKKISKRQNQLLKRNRMRVLK